MNLSLLIAAGDIELIVKLLIAVVFVIGALFKKIRDVAEMAKPAAPPAPLQPALPEAAAPANPQATLAREIQDFLKQATQVKRPAAAPQPSSAKKSAKRSAPKPRPQAVELSQPGPATESIAQHVERAMSTRDVTDHSQHLVDDLTRLDRERAERLQRLGGRQIGTLQDTTKGQAEAPPADDAPAAPTSLSADALANLLASPGDVRKAIVLQEILSRRW